MEVVLYCRRCKKSTRVSHIVTGNAETMVLEHSAVACKYCSRIIRYKKYTEAMLIERQRNGKAYL